MKEANELINKLLSTLNLTADIVINTPKENFNKLFDTLTEEQLVNYFIQLPIFEKYANNLELDDETMNKLANLSEFVTFLDKKSYSLTDKSLIKIKGNLLTPKILANLTEHEQAEYIRIINDASSTNIFQNMPDEKFKRL